MLSDSCTTRDALQTLHSRPETYIYIYICICSTSILIRLKRQVLMSQRSTWLWAIRTDMSADARSVLAAVDGFCALSGLALIPLLPSFDFLLCHSMFAIAWPLCVRGCRVALCSRLLGRFDGAGDEFVHNKKCGFCVTAPETNLFMTCIFL